MKIFSRLVFLVVVPFLMSSCKKAFQKDGSGHNETNWIRLGPGGGGGTFIPTFSYHDAAEFFIRCDMTGAYHTKDGGHGFDQINNPDGSYSFAFDPSYPKVMYVGSKVLKRSLDGGRTWEMIFPSPEEVLDTVFLGDHANFSLITSESSLYNKVASAGGETFGKSQSLTIKNIKVDPTDSRKVYFSSGNHFFYSVDSGANWSNIELDAGVDFIYTDSINARNKVYAFTDSSMAIIDKDGWHMETKEYPVEMQPAFSVTGGTIKENGRTIFYALQNDEPSRAYGEVAPTSLWFSKDFGATWQLVQNSEITNRKGPEPTYSMIAAAENDAGKVYVVTSSYQERTAQGKVSNWFGTLKSSDAGENWEWVWKGGGGSGTYGVRDNEDAPNLKDAWVQKAFGKDFIRLISVGVAPNDGDVAIVTDWYRSMKTMDGGKTWASVYSEEQSDGTYTSSGLDVTTAYGVHQDPFDPEHLAISYTDIGYHHSFNGGESWSRSPTGIPINWQNTCYWMVFDPKVKDRIWSVWSSMHDFPRGKMTRKPNWEHNAYGGVAVSLDGGSTWTPKVHGMGLDSPATSMVLDKNSPEDSRVLYVSVYGKGVFKSLDGAESWKLHNNGIQGSLAAFELTIQEDGTLFLITSPVPQHKGGEVGNGVHMGAVYKSIDGANTWTKLDLGDKVKFPNGLTYDSQNPNRLYLGAWSDILLSDLVGGHVAKEFGGNRLIDIEGGILLSEDSGNSWKQIFDGDKFVYDVTTDPRFPGRLYANTFNQGAYRSDDHGKTWHQIKGYDFHWGHRVMVDENHGEKVYLTTFGSSVWHGKPLIDSEE